MDSFGLVLYTLVYSIDQIWHVNRSGRHIAKTDLGVTIGGSRQRRGCQKASEIFVDYYLRQGGCDLHGVCLFVCLPDNSKRY